MKKNEKETRESVNVPGLRLNAKERKILRTSLNEVNELSDRLGLYDPMDGESPMIFFAEEGKR